LTFTLLLFFNSKHNWTSSLHHWLQRHVHFKIQSTAEKLSYSFWFPPKEGGLTSKIYWIIVPQCSVSTKSWCIFQTYLIVGVKRRKVCSIIKSYWPLCSKKVSLNDFYTWIICKFCFRLSTNVGAMSITVILVNPLQRPIPPWNPHCLLSNVSICSIGDTLPKPILWIWLCVAASIHQRRQHWSLFMLVFFNQNYPVL
jgi:hypothetical protein